MKRLVLFLTAIALLTFSACASNNEAFRMSGSSSTANSSAMPASAPVPASGADAQTRLDASFEKVSDGQTTTESAPVQRKIIRNAELTIETQNSEESFRRVSSLAEAKGGFVVTSEANQPEGSAEPGKMIVNVTLRIPAAQFDSTIEEIRKVGDRVLQDKRTGQDVTEEYIDLQARLQAKKALEAQFLEIMKQAKEVSDALEVQKQLAEVRSEIEQMEGKRRFLENQSSLSTIKVAIVPPVQILGVGRGGAKEAFRDGLSAAATIIYFLVRMVLASLPLLVIIGLPTWLIVRYLMRRAARAKLS